MITFNREITLHIVEEFNEATDTIEKTSVETFKAGEKVDADICSEDGNFVDLQFGGGGGVAFGVPKEWFDEVKA